MAEFSRLECREIIRCLTNTNNYDGDIDEDVYQKLLDGAKNTKKQPEIVMPAASTPHEVAMARKILESEFKTQTFPTPPIGSTPKGHNIVEASPLIGTKNRVGDECLAVDNAGVPVYKCKEGHGYTMSAAPGCPRCFVSGGEEEPAKDDEDSGEFDETF